MRTGRLVLARLVLATAVGVPFIAGCGAGAAQPGGTAASPKQTLTVFAAASLTDTFSTLADQFEQEHPGVQVVVNVGASSALAAQILAGAPADVFASAATTAADRVVDAGLAAPGVLFARNSMQIAVPADNPGGIDDVQDLADADVTVAVCAVQVPCGVGAQGVFEKAGITVRPVTYEADVKATLAKVRLGEVDAGVVYVTDVRAAADDVRGVTIPAQVNVSTDYPIVTLHDAPPVATEFVAWVRSPAGQRVLREAGFAQP